MLQQYLPFTVLKHSATFCLTAYSAIKLQQYLPFTVLKPSDDRLRYDLIRWLQQYLPFTVLKLTMYSQPWLETLAVATVLTVYGIETYEPPVVFIFLVLKLQQYLPFTVLKQS